MENAELLERGRCDSVSVQARCAHAHLCVCVCVCVCGWVCLLNGRSCFRRAPTAAAPQGPRARRACLSTRCSATSGSTRCRRRMRGTLGSIKGPFTVFLLCHVTCVDQALVIKRSVPPKEVPRCVFSGFGTLVTQTAAPTHTEIFPAGRCAGLCATPPKRGRC